MTFRVLHLPLALVVAGLLSACAVGPTYETPSTPSFAAWKEAPAAAGWLPAAPADALDRGEWWRLFNDPVLDELASRVQVSNQNVAAAVANYRQAQALVREQRAALFPTVSASADARRTGARNSTPVDSRSLSIGADWAPDLWGRLGLAVTGAEASAQATEADLASARLSAIGTLASNYFQLRESDAEIQLLDATLEGYQRSLTIARNRYEAGIAAQSDVLQAQTLLVNTQAERAALVASRQTLEHAIAVLVGAAPADFNLPVASWTPTVPGVPLAVPSTLLQRRPDIASAERSVAAANAQIGIARSAYFPSLSLSASVGSSASRVGDLFNASSLLWSLGLSVAQNVFDAGATAARIEGARAQHEAAVARYRQTTLTAFQDVEDRLTASASLAQQEVLRREASQLADRSEQQFLNRYRQGQVSFTEVVTAQASALNARRVLVQTQVNRQVTAVALIQGLGGGWRAPDEPRSTAY